MNYADSYLYVGFPAGLIVLLIALPLFGTLWIPGQNAEVERSYARAYHSTECNEPVIACR